MAQKLFMAAIILINCYPHFSGKLGRWERAILALTYYTGRVHLILVQNLNIARHSQFCLIYQFISRVIEF